MPPFPESPRPVSPALPKLSSLESTHNTVARGTVLWESLVGKPRGKDSCSSVPQLCPTLCDPMNHSMPGLPVHHQIPEFMPSSHLILCHPLLLLPPILPSIRVFSNESTLRMRWPKFIVHLPTLIYSNNCCSVTKLCPALFDPLDCSTPNSSVLYYLLGFAQTHVH